MNVPSDRGRGQVTQTDHLEAIPIRYQIWSPGALKPTSLNHPSHSALVAIRGEPFIMFAERGRERVPKSEHSKGGCVNVVL